MAVDENNEWSAEKGASLGTISHTSLYYKKGTWYLGNDRGRYLPENQWEASDYADAYSIYRAYDGRWSNTDWFKNKGDTFRKNAKEYKADAEKKENDRALQEALNSISAAMAKTQDPVEPLKQIQSATEGASSQVNHSMQLRSGLLSAYNRYGTYNNNMPNKAQTLGGLS